MGWEWDEMRQVSGMRWDEMDGMRGWAEMR